MGRRKKHEGNRFYFETAVEDRGGSGDSGADFICLALCGAGLSLRPGAGACQYIFCPLWGIHADCWSSPEWDHRFNTGFSDFSLWIAEGCYLAAGQGTGFEICHSGFGL